MVGRAVLLGSAAFLLAGCFDSHYDLGLNNDGSGRIAVEIVLDKDLSRDVLKDGKGKLEKQKPESDLGKNARTSQRVENGSIVVAQVLDFKSPSDITGGGIYLEVLDSGRSILGAAHSRIRFSATSNPATAHGRRQAASDYGDQLVGQMFKGHVMSVTMHLPCVVETANTQIFDGVAYNPTVEKSWLRGSTVKWQLPMAAMMKQSSHGSLDDFIVTCWSFAGITPGHSRAK